MSASQHSIARLTFIILNKGRFTNLFLKFSLRKRFKEITTIVFKNTGFDNNDSFYISLYNFHYFNSFLVLQLLSVSIGHTDSSALAELAHAFYQK